MDLRAELERSIPVAPPLRPAAERLPSGRAALRRRRVTVGAAVLGVVAAVVVPVAVASGGPTAQRGFDPATPPPTTAPSPDPAPDPDPGPDRARDRDRTAGYTTSAGYPWSKGEAAGVDFRKNEPVLRPGATVLVQRQDLFPGKETESVALVLGFRGERYWTALEWDGDGGTSQYTWAGDPSYDDFDDFVAQFVSTGGMQHGPPVGTGDDDLPTPTEVDVTWTGDGFRAGSGITILEQRQELDLPRSFAEPGATVGAALVESEGHRSLVLYRNTAHAKPQTISVAATGHGADLDEALAWARERYRSGAGLL